jgi:hypothetical protein
MVRAARLSLAACACCRHARLCARSEQPESSRRLSVGVGAQILPSFPAATIIRSARLFTGFSRRDG